MCLPHEPINLAQSNPAKPGFLSAFGATGFYPSELPVSRAKAPVMTAPSPRAVAAVYKQGFTLLELLVVVAIMGILLGVGALNLRPLSNDLQNDTNLVVGIFKQARVKAVATTSGYRIVKKSGTRLIAEYSNSCTGTTWTEDSRLSVNLEHDTRIQESNGTLTCFSSKGLATTNPTLNLKNSAGKTRQVEVFLGGSVEVR